MPEVFSLSFFLEPNTPNYGGEKDTVKLSPSRSIVLGHTSNNHYFQFPGHINTHIDFPKHFSANGKTLNDYAPSFWVFNNVELIQCDINNFEKEISKLNASTEMVIYKSGFGKYRGEDRYWAEQPVIPAAFASILKAKCPNLRVFGFDMISLTSQLDKSEGKKAHIAFLLESDILVVEDMNLTEIKQSPSRVIIAPLLIKNADGVPCNILAFE
jgi:hypothetical protein